MSIALGMDVAAIEAGADVDGVTAEVGRPTSAIENPGPALSDDGTTVAGGGVGVGEGIDCDGDAGTNAGLPPPAAGKGFWGVGMTRALSVAGNGFSGVGRIEGVRVD